MTDPHEITIAALSVSHCYLCGVPGEPLYSNLEDRLFEAPGSWNLRRCPECGLAWLDPMPTKETIGLAYKNYYTHEDEVFRNTEGRLRSLLKRALQFIKGGYLAWRYGYHTAGTLFQKLTGALLLLHPGRRAALDQSILWLKAKPGGRLLDVGCGSGALLETFRSLDWRVEGVEVDPKAAEQARSKGLTVRLGTLDEQQYPPDFFDGITLSHVIEHVHDPIGLLRECRRILRPGGLLVATTPNLESWGHSKFQSAWRGLEPPRHLYLFTLRSMESSARKAEFAIQTLRTSPVGAPFIFEASRVIASAGRYRIDSVAPLGERLRSRIFFWLEWALLKWKRDLGEELVLIAEK
ncbi:MAG: class I SAM-dependent methyltransferase [Deltaproteobacteria bacterium]|nr:class I SAM-dependent methyltransferase [Deltaproteobacteria bacterium]